jgi:GTP-binding protein HflX
LEELRSLAESATYDIVGLLEQVREQDPSYQIGSGKAEELADLAKKTGAEKIIFDNELKPLQAYNLAKVTGVEIIDRFQLILEIFARRVSTKEANLQIELAKLQYELPRAREKVKLAKRGEQPGFMGLGKYEVELYFESVKRQADDIRDKLRKVGRKRDLQRSRRLDLGYSLVSLAGYTNSGKSSVFNVLAEETVPVGSGLFTTLSTTTREINIFGRRVLLTDTVGFIDRLPITLVEAFHSTLEETVFSDLILLVVDISEPLEKIEKKIDASLDTIQKIGANGIPIMAAFNKVDMLSDVEVKSKVEILKSFVRDGVAISALQKTNIGPLREAILNHLGDYIYASFNLPITSEALSYISWLFSRAEVHKVEYTGDSVTVIFEAIPWFADKVKGHAQRFGGNFTMLSKKKEIRAG